MGQKTTAITIKNYSETLNLTFTIVIKISKIKKVKTPTRGTSKSAGIDFYVPDEYDSIPLKPGESVNIKSGIKLKIPEGKALVFFNKSGVALKQGLQVGACVIDEDYQGEVHLHVTNISFGRKVIEAGQKLVQGLLLDVSYDEIVEVNQLELFDEETERSSRGFGSTGHD